jgi:hypothetical protein
VGFSSHWIWTCLGLGSPRLLVICANYEHFIHQQAEAQPAREPREAYFWWHKRPSIKLALHAGGLTPQQTARQNSSTLGYDHGLTQAPSHAKCGERPHARDAIISRAVQSILGTVTAESTNRRCEMALSGSASEGCPPLQPCRRDRRKTASTNAHAERASAQFFLSICLSFPASRCPCVLRRVTPAMQAAADSYDACVCLSDVWRRKKNKDTIRDQRNQEEKKT